jgi:hypothetical protein
MVNKISLPISEEPAIVNLLARMPEDVRVSFSEVQLAHLHNAVGTRQWGKHRVDFRTTFGLFSRRYYLVFLAGHNIRSMTREQQKRQLLINSIVLSLVLVLCMLVGLLALYLIKSALGIDLFDDFSLGIWSLFKSFPEL